MAYGIILPFPQHRRVPETQVACRVSLGTLGSNNSPEIITHCDYYLCPSFKRCCCQGLTSQFQEERQYRSPLHHRSVCNCSLPLTSVRLTGPAALLLHLPWRESYNLVEPSHLLGISAGLWRWGGVCQRKAFRC